MHHKEQALHGILKIIPTTVLATSAARKATVGAVQEVFTLFPHKKQHAQETHISDSFAV